MPIAINCRLEPTTKLAMEVDITAMEDNVGEAVEGGVCIGIGVVFDEQDVMTMIKAAINPKARK